MKLKFLSFILCIILASGSFGAMANNLLTTNPVYDSQTDNIEISGNGSGILTVIITPPGLTLDSLTDSVLPLYYNIITANNSFYNIKYNVASDFEGGECNVYVTDETGLTVSSSLIIPSSQNNPDLIKKLKASGSAKLLSDTIDENCALLGIDTTDELWISSKTAIAGILISSGSEYENIKEFYHAYHKAYATASLNGKNEEEISAILRNNRIYLGIDADSDFDDYEFVADNAKKALVKLISEADFAKLIKEEKNHDFVNVFSDLKFVAEVSSASGYMTLKEIITDKYENVLSPSENKYYKKLTYPDKVFSKMMSYELSDTAKIKKAFEECAKKCYDEENPPKPSKGSGGGGGGGGGSVTLPRTDNTQKDTNELKPEIIFDDVTDYHWAYNPISFLADKQILNGYGNLFKPDQSITRAEFVALICRVFRLTSSEQTTDFKDVDSSDWYCGYVQTAAENGIVQGDENGFFNPDKHITRQDACVIINRAVSNYGIELKPGKAVIFDDKNDIALYALSDVSILFANKIVKGTTDKTFEPQNPISRAQTAQLIYNTMEYLKISDF